MKDLFLGKPLGRIVGVLLPSQFPEGITPNRHFPVASPTPRKTSSMRAVLLAPCPPIRLWGQKWGTRRKWWSNIMCLEHSLENKIQYVPQVYCLPKLTTRRALTFAPEKRTKLEKREGGPQNGQGVQLLIPPGERRPTVSRSDGGGWKQCTGSSQWPSKVSQVRAAGFDTAYPSDGSALSKEGEGPKSSYALNRLQYLM